MKFKHVLLIAFLVITIDQILKIYIKTHFELDQSQALIGNWAKFHFAENPGMAWSLKIAGPTGKLFLTLFRLGAVIFGVFYLKRLIAQRYTKGFLICASLIWAGAIGNLLDSMFYGLIFDTGMLYDKASSDYYNYQGISQFTTFGTGYTKLFMGNVVDMFYFPLFDIPLGNGKKIEFFNAIFNIADAAISVGVLTIIFFQKKLYRRYEIDIKSTLQTKEVISDENQVS